VLRKDGVVTTASINMYYLLGTHVIMPRFYNKNSHRGDIYVVERFIIKDIIVQTVTLFLIHQFCWPQQNSTHGHQFFPRRWMDSNRVVKINLTSFHLNGDSKPLNDFIAAKTDDMNPDDSFLWTHND